MTRRKSTTSASRRQASTPKAPIGTRSAVSTRKRARQTAFDRSVLKPGTRVELQEAEGAWVNGRVVDVRAKFSPDFSTTDLRRKRKRLRASRAKGKGKSKGGGVGIGGGSSVETGCFDTWMLVETAEYREWVLYEKDGLLRLPGGVPIMSSSSHNTRSKGGVVVEVVDVGSVKRGTKRSRRKGGEEDEEEEGEVKKRKTTSMMATRSSKKAALVVATPKGKGKKVAKVLDVEEKKQETVEEKVEVNEEEMVEVKGKVKAKQEDEEKDEGKVEVKAKAKAKKEEEEKEDGTKSGVEASKKEKVEVEQTKEERKVENEVVGVEKEKEKKEKMKMKKEDPKPPKEASKEKEKEKAQDDVSVNVKDKGKDKVKGNEGGAKGKGKAKAKAKAKESNGSCPPTLPTNIASPSVSNQTPNGKSTSASTKGSGSKAPVIPQKKPVVDLTAINYDRIVPPHNVGQLAEQLGFSLSRLFKELGLVGIYEKSAYSWSSYKLCHRANTITAGIVLSEWFHEHIKEAISCLVIDETARLNWVNEFKSKINGRNPPVAKLLHVSRVFTIYPGKNRKRYKLKLTTENARAPPWTARIFVRFEFESRAKERAPTEILVGEFRSAEQLTVARKLAMKDLGDLINSGKPLPVETMRKVVLAAVAGDRVQAEIASKRRLREKAKASGSGSGSSRKDGKAKSKAKTKKYKKKEVKSVPERRARKQERGRRRDEEKSREGSVRGGWRLRKRRDAVESETRTEWLGEGYPGACAKGRGQKYYTGFRFTDNQEECSVLDHVLVYREDNVDTDSVPPKTNELMAKDYYIGQIEALWEEPDASRHVRIAWFYWPEETEMGRTAETHTDEVFCSSEVDTNPLSAISCRIKVVSYEQYQSMQTSNTRGEESRAKLATRIPSPPLSQGEAEEGEMEKGARIRQERLDLLKAFQETRVLFSRHFYNHKSALLEGVKHPSRKEGTGKCPWLHSFLFATQQNPDVSDLLSPEDIRNDLCPSSRGVVDIDLALLCGGVGREKNKGTVENERDVFEAQKAAAAHCSYCYQSLFLLPSFSCAVCSDVVLCLDCFTRGRQGAVESKSKPGSSVKLIHKAAHPYKVCRPQLSLQHAGMGVRALDYVVSLYGGLSVHYELVSIVRGPLASKEHRGPAPRFCYGLRLEPCEENDTRERGRKLGSGSRTLGKAYGRTVEEARGLVALSALQSVFGIGNELSMKVLGLEWTAFEALRLLDSIGVYGLAWEPAATIVGSKSVLQGRDFYNQRLLPAWASAEEWAKKYQDACKDPKVLHSINKQYTGKTALPAASPTVVAKAVEEAMLWARQVDGMVTRRSRLARKKKRGLSIALVDKMIVYAPRPASFGPYATSQTASLSQPGEDMAALREGSVCAVCKKTDDPQLIVLCDGCDEEFHIGCLTPPLSTVPEGDWFCNNCMEDRAYLYDHCSWGDSGKILCKLATKHGKSMSTGEHPLSVRQWEDNDEVLRAATMKAIQMGYAHGGTPPSPKPALSNRKKRQAEEGKLAEPGRKKRKYETKKSKGAVHFNPEDPDVQNAVSWATRHFADAAVSALEATTKGLAQALQTVVAQRDALAAELDRLKKQYAAETDATK